MYSTTKDYYIFLEKLKKEKEDELQRTTHMVNCQMDNFMSGQGWERKGKGQKVSYTKVFNGKPIVIGFRCNLQDTLGNGGLPEFVHDKSIPNSIEKIQMCYFHWNDQPTTSGCNLDGVMERIEEFYNKYTL
jgi:hypothetical protein